MATILVANNSGVLHETMSAPIVTESVSTLVYSSKTDSELLEKMERIRPDLVILDLIMPSEALSRLTRDLRTVAPQVPIFMIADACDFEMERRAISCGVNAVFSKQEGPATLFANARVICGD